MRRSFGRLPFSPDPTSVQRHVATGRAHILNMTLSQRWGRLFVSVCYAVRTPATARTVTFPTVRAGMDLGIRTLATVATVDTVTGAETVVEYPNPAPLRETLTARRRAGRELSRRIPGSRGHRAAKAKLARLDRRCVHLRREATHQLITELAGSYGQSPCLGLAGDAVVIPIAGRPIVGITLGNVPAAVLVRLRAVCVRPACLC